MERISNVAQLEALRESLHAAHDPERPVVRVCLGPGCLALGANKVSRAFQAAIKGKGIKASVQPLIKETGCHGFCSQGTLVNVDPFDLFYVQVKPEDAEEIVENTLLKGQAVERLLYGDNGTRYRSAAEVPFYKMQQKVVLKNVGVTDPLKIEDALMGGAYRSLARVLTGMTPDEVIAAMEASGLRGRGGGGFPTGRKWRFAVENARKNPGPIYVVGNGDEGDPGAFMDRTLMEGDPHAVLEGMAIGAYALGAQQGYIYVRMEYPLAIKHLRIAIEQARALGLLGENILGTGFNFDVRINRGAGAFVCGEETALIASLEGRVGEPIPRPPYPAEKGLWGRPTIINNVETWANVPLIIDKGAGWYASLGVPTSTGTKVFSLVGKVKNSGLIEVPMGITLAQIVEEIGGGVPGQDRFKAVQTGGPSGGCIPYELKDTPVDYDSLRNVGSIMGSGGMIVMDQRDCVVDVARYFLGFLEEESCGKCLPCRLGLKSMQEYLDNFAKGQGSSQDIDDLLSLARAIMKGSLCALGGTAPNPILTSLRYFRDEYLEHIVDKECRALVCKALSPAPCQYACPAGIDVPNYVALIGHGRYEDALNLIREDNPLPSVCGYVCPAPCESKCRRGETDQPIAIRTLKRFVADFVRKHGEEAPPANIYRKEKVAIVGSGPAGLTAAYYLSRDGYPVTVFEALPVLGGMLRVGIPDFRLPREVLEFDIQTIARRGVTFQTNSPIGKDLTLDDLKKQGYQAIFLSMGAHQDIRLGIKGEEQPGVLSGVEFLRQVALDQKVTLGNNLVVIGGGNVAIDAARTALRLGSSVTILYRRSRAEMPAYAHEVAQALDEGVEIRFLTQPVEISGNGKVTGIVCQDMELGEPDSSGRRRPIPVPGSEKVLTVDAVIKAIGQMPEPLKLSISRKTLKLTRWQTIEAHPVNFSTNIRAVFAGGDVVTGPATVVEAVKAGKQVARSINRYLTGEHLEERSPLPLPRMKTDPLEITPEEAAKLKRPEMPERSASDRVKDFSLVELGFTESQCRNEGKRCLRCDLG